MGDGCFHMVEHVVHIEIDGPTQGIDGAGLGSMGRDNDHLVKIPGDGMGLQPGSGLRLSRGMPPPCGNDHLADTGGMESA